MLINLRFWYQQSLINCKIGGGVYYQLWETDKAVLQNILNSQCIYLCLQIKKMEPNSNLSPAFIDDHVKEGKRRT